MLELRKQELHHPSLITAQLIKGREAKLVPAYQRDTHYPMVYGTVWTISKSDSKEGI